MDIEKIEARLAEIKNEAELPEANIDALTEEVRSLKEAKMALIAEEEKRNAVRDAVANGEIGETVKEFKECSNMEERIFAVDSREYRDAYVKNIFKRDLTDMERRALGSAGAVIPTMTVNDVLGRMKETPILGAVATSQFPTYVRFPVLSASANAASGAIGAAIQEGTNSITYADLTPCQYTKRIDVQSDIANMSIDALHSWLVDDITGKIRLAIAADVLVGSGTNCCKGISASVNANATNLHSTVTKADLLKVMATLPAEYHANATWVMTPGLFYEEVMAVSALNDYVVNDGFRLRLFGHPVILMSEACISTKETIFFGDLREYKLNYFSPIEIKAFEEVGSLDTKYRGGCMVDGELCDTNAFVRFAKA